MDSSTPNLNVTLGPIIGKVTHNTARILIEFDQEAEVTCTLKSDLGDASTCTLKSKANVPVVFSFKDLKPKTHYKVGLSCTLALKSSFWTMRENDDGPGKLNVAVVSCNEVSHQEHKTSQTDLWTDLRARVERHELDYLFHMGDQVYMDMGAVEKDTPYFTIHPILQTIDPSQWESKRAELLDIIRDKYRRTWSYNSIARVLANVPNLTILDDHEVRDDWGFRKEDYTPGTLDHFYGQLARHVYYEYQRQLREDIPWDNLDSLKHEYYDEVINGVGISFMEYRACRSWFREELLEENRMGKDQAAWLESLYRENGKFENLNSALFITPLPLFFLSHFGSHLMFVNNDDLQEHWTYNAIPQLAKLLDLLRDWKERKTGREIAVIGGDVHTGGWTDIYYKDKPIFTQFISSAVNGKVAGHIHKALLTVLHKVGALNSDYHFKHHDWSTENNIGVIEVDYEHGKSFIKPLLIVLKPIPY